ncbi:MAG: DUF3298 domain-containing protein [Lachnospiraceae bacterium]|nr:DUF3298 domain-containing protein [Lachnospiraceae bacterium]
MKKIEKIKQVREKYKRCMFFGGFLLVLIAIGGCGNAVEAGTTIPSEEKEQIREMEEENLQAATQEEPQEETQEEPGEEAQREPWPEAPILTCTVWEDNRFDEDGTLLAEGTLSYFEMSARGYESAAAAVEAFFRSQEDDFEKNMDLLEEYGQDTYITSQEEDWLEFYPYYSRQDWEITRADAGIISFCGRFSEYFGGAHDQRWTSGVTFDAKTGKELRFLDLAKDQEKFLEETLNVCLEAAEEKREDYNFFPDYEEVIRSRWQEEPEWYLDGSGITVLFSPYEIAPFASGTVRLHLPYQEFGEYLLPEYAMGASEGMALLPENEEVRIEMGYDRLVSSYLLQRTDGRSFLLFDGDMASEDYVTYIYEVTDGKRVKTWESDVTTRIRQGSVTPQGSLELGLRLDVLGTHMTYGHFQITEEGTVEEEGAWYSLERETILTTVRELPVLVAGEEKTLSAGSRLLITGTDRKGIMGYIDTASGEEGEIHYTLSEEGRPVYIEGVEETQYFEDLPYAG